MGRRTGIRVLGVAVVLAGGGHLFLRDTAGFAPQATANAAARACAVQTEACFARGGDNCVGRMHECLNVIAELEPKAPGELRFAYSAGKHPPEQSVLSRAIERASAAI